MTSLRIPFLRPPPRVSADQVYEAADRAFLRHLHRVKARHILLVCLLAFAGALGVGVFTAWLTARSARDQSAVEHPGRVLSQEEIRDFLSGLRSAARR